MRILSVVPDSAATERIFSKMGTVRSKLRSRLHPGKVRKTVLVAEHMENSGLARYMPAVNGSLVVIQGAPRSWMNQVDL